MRYLLDTHTLLWWLSDKNKLNSAELKVLNDSDTTIFLSSVVIWEISVKSSLNKLDIPINYFKELEKSSFVPLPISHKHALKIAKLPHIHHDPFDRLLIAQAQIEKLALLTQDRIIKKYTVKTI